MEYLWPELSIGYDHQAEVILLFRVQGGRVLKLASNYPYGIYLDDKFIGDGGHRCAPYQAFIQSG